MDFENTNNQQDLNETVEEVVEETVEEVAEDTQAEYTGCDEDLSEELTDEEYEQMLDSTPLAEEKKPGFFAELKNQAVCKLLFLFAAIGFIFPFFTVSCDDIVYNAYSTTGINTFKDMAYNLGEYGELIASKQFMAMAAFAIIVIGLILTVIFKSEIRNIAGLVCSVASAACLGVFAYMLPTLLDDSMNTFLAKLSKEVSAAYGTTIDLTDATTATNMGLDLSGLKVVLDTGWYFVMAILVVNAIYFIIQLSANSKKKANVDMTLVEGEFPDDFDPEELFDLELGDSIEETVEEIVDEVEEIIEEKTEE